MVMWSLMNHQDGEASGPVTMFYVWVVGGGPLIEYDGPGASTTWADEVTVNRANGAVRRAMEIVLGSPTWVENRDRRQRFMSRHVSRWSDNDVPAAKECKHSFISLTRLQQSSEDRCFSGWVGPAMV